MSDDDFPAGVIGRIWGRDGEYVGYPGDDWQSDLPQSYGDDDAQDYTMLALDQWTMPDEPEKIEALIQSGIRDARTVYRRNKALVAMADEIERLRAIVDAPQWKPVTRTRGVESNGDLMQIWKATTGGTHFVWHSVELKAACRYWWPLPSWTRVDNKEPVTCKACQRIAGHVIRRFQGRKEPNGDQEGSL